MTLLNPINSDSMEGCRFDSLSICVAFACFVCACRVFFWYSGVLPQTKNLHVFGVSETMNGLSHFSVCRSGIDLSPVQGVPELNRKTWIKGVMTRKSIYTVFGTYVV